MERVSLFGGNRVRLVDVFVVGIAALGFGLVRRLLKRVVSAVCVRILVQHIGVTFILAGQILLFAANPACELIRPQREQR